MRIIIDHEDIERIVELGQKFPLNTITLDNYRDFLIFETKLAGGYTEYFKVKIL